MNTKRSRHPIAVISRRTGLPQDLLRAWERRYEAVIPERTPTGRRLYSDQDLERLNLMKELLAHGHRIGNVAGLALDELHGLLQESRKHETRREQPAEAAHVDLPAAMHSGMVGVEDAFSAVEASDAGLLNLLLHRAAVTLSLAQLLEQLIQPLLVKIGDTWHAGEMRISQEHMATAVIRSFLGAMLLKRRLPENSPRIICAAPGGQVHELGALMAALTSQEAGWSAEFLGPDLPAEEIAGIALARGARAVALSIVHVHDHAQLVLELESLLNYLPMNISIVAGGQAAHDLLESSPGMGGRVLFIKSLRGLKEHLHNLSI
jgi:DNA-binding transcriptional MerR regulator/methylmalonyl-CoA mutase cobalamin-binding subunit